MLQGQPSECITRHTPTSEWLVRNALTKFSPSGTAIPSAQLIRIFLLGLFAWRLTRLWMLDHSLEDLTQDLCEYRWECFHGFFKGLAPHSLWQSSEFVIGYPTTSNWLVRGAFTKRSPSGGAIPSAQPWMNLVIGAWRFANCGIIFFQWVPHQGQLNEQASTNDLIFNDSSFLIPTNYLLERLRLLPRSQSGERFPNMFIRLKVWQDLY